MDNDNSAPSVLEEDTSKSLAAVLKLARAKGYIAKEEEKKRMQPTVVINSAKKAKLEVQALRVDDRRDEGGSSSGNRSRGDHHGRHHGHHRRGAQVREVKESEDFKPEINLEYTDDTGRKLDKPKDQYRYICYKFHGKGPGKNKIDKRLQKLEQERKQKEALTTDVPSSASLMISKQKELQSPFIVLSKGK